MRFSGGWNCSSRQTAPKSEMPASAWGRPDLPDLVSRERDFVLCLVLHFVLAADAMSHRNRGKRKEEGSPSVNVAGSARGQACSVLLSSRCCGWKRLPSLRIISPKCTF